MTPQTWTERTAARLLAAYLAHRQSMTTSPADQARGVRFWGVLFYLCERGSRTRWPA